MFSTVDGMMSVQCHDSYNNNQHIMRHCLNKANQTNTEHVICIMNINRGT